MAATAENDPILAAMEAAGAAPEIADDDPILAAMEAATPRTGPAPEAARAGWPRTNPEWIPGIVRKPLEAAGAMAYYVPKAVGTGITSTKQGFAETPASMLQGLTAFTPGRALGLDKLLEATGAGMENWLDEEKRRYVQEAMSSPLWPEKMTTEAWGRTLEAWAANMGKFIPQMAATFAGHYIGFGAGTLVASSLAGAGVISAPATGGTSAAGGLTVAAALPVVGAHLGGYLPNMLAETQSALEAYLAEGIDRDIAESEARKYGLISGLIEYSGALLEMRQLKGLITGLTKQVGMAVGEGAEEYTQGGLQEHFRNRAIERMRERNPDFVAQTKTGKEIWLSRERGREFALGAGFGVGVAGVGVAGRAAVRKVAGERAKTTAGKTTVEGEAPEAQRRGPEEGAKAEPVGARAPRTAAEVEAAPLFVGDEEIKQPRMDAKEREEGREGARPAEETTGETPVPPAPEVPDAGVELAAVRAEIAKLRGQESLSRGDVARVRELEAREVALGGVVAQRVAQARETPKSLARQWKEAQIGLVRDILAINNALPQAKDAAHQARLEAKREELIADAIRTERRFQEMGLDTGVMQRARTQANKQLPDKMKADLRKRLAAQRKKVAATPPQPSPQAGREAPGAAALSAQAGMTAKQRMSTPVEALTDAQLADSLEFARRVEADTAALEGRLQQALDKAAPEMRPTLEAQIRGAGQSVENARRRVAALEAEQQLRRREARAPSEREGGGQNVAQGEGRLQALQREGQAPGAGVQDQGWGAETAAGGGVLQAQEKPMKQARRRELEGAPGPGEYEQRRLAQREREEQARRRELEGAPGPGEYEQRRLAQREREEQARRRELEGAHERREGVAGVGGAAVAGGAVPAAGAAARGAGVEQALPGAAEGRTREAGGAGRVAAAVATQTDEEAAAQLERDFNATYGARGELPEMRVRAVTADPGNKLHRTVKALGEAFGIRVVLVEGEMAGGALPWGGAYDRQQRGTIFVNVGLLAKGGNPAQVVVGHEVAEMLYEEHPDLWRQIAEAVAEAVGGREALIAKWTGNLDAKGRLQIAMKSEDVFREAVNDALGEQMTKRGFLETLAERAPEALRRLIEILDELIGRLTSFMRQPAQRNRIEPLMESRDAVMAVRRTMADVLAEYHRRQAADVVAQKTGGEIAEMERLPRLAELPAARQAEGTQGIYQHPEEEREFRVRYRVVEAADVIPSNRGREYDADPRYPREVQPRDYKNEPGEQEKVEKHARNLNPLKIVTKDVGPVNGPPIVNERGIVLVGNSRMQSINRAIESWPEKYEGYKQYLAEHAGEYGVESAAVAAMEKPVLVRDVGEMTMAQMKEFARKGNRDETAARDPLSAALELAANMGVESIVSMDLEGEEEGTFQAALGEARVAQPLIAEMRRVGAITPANEALFITRDRETREAELNTVGKQLVQDAMLARVLDKPIVFEEGGQRAVMTPREQLEMLRDKANKKWLTALTRSLPGLVSIRRSIEMGVNPDMDITGDIIGLVNQMVRRGTRYWEDMQEQTDFIVGAIPQRVEIVGRRLAGRYSDCNYEHPAQMAKAIAHWAEIIADMARKGQSDLIGGATVFDALLAWASKATTKAPRMQIVGEGPRMMLEAPEGDLSAQAEQGDLFTYMGPGLAFQGKVPAAMERRVERNPDSVATKLWVEQTIKKGIEAGQIKNELTGREQEAAQREMLRWDLAALWEEELQKRVGERETLEEPGQRDMFGAAVRERELTEREREARAEARRRGEAGPRMMFAEPEERPPWVYSKLVRFVEGFAKNLPKEATVGEFTELVRKAGQKAGVKPAEIEWVIEREMDPKARMTREQFVEAVRENQLEIKEIVERVESDDPNRGPQRRENEEEIARLEEALREEPPEALLPDELFDREEQFRIAEELRDVAFGVRHYEDIGRWIADEDKRHYVIELAAMRALEGFDQVVNWRANKRAGWEPILSKPYLDLWRQQGEKEHQWTSRRARNLSDIEEARAMAEHLENTPEEARFSGWVVPGEARRYGNLVIQWGNRPLSAAVSPSTHWDSTPNVLVHVRYDERRGPDGQRILFVNEIQSDWHEQGRKQGYAPTGPIPEGPFAKTEQWVQLGLKRMIRWAAENGYDQVAWATGKESADIYNLRKVVDSIEAQRAPNGEGFDLVADKNGKRLIARRVKDESEMADVVGKDVARKLIERIEADPQDAQGAGWGKVEGADLAVGGHGMVAFYDKIVPAAANDLLKLYGGGKVRPIETVMGPATTAPHMGFDITPEMKRVAMTVGAPVMQFDPDAAAAARRQEMMKADERRGLWLAAAKVLRRNGGMGRAPALETSANRHSAAYLRTLSKPTQERYEAAAREFKPQGSLLARAFTRWRNLVRGFASPTPHIETGRKALLALPAEARRARNKAVEWLRRQKDHIKTAAVEAARNLGGAYEGLSADEMALLRDAIVARDYLYEVERAERKGDAEGAFQFGMTADEVRRWNAEVEKDLAEHPEVVRALGARDAWFRKAAAELLRLGKITAEQAKNPYYFHHVLLEYDMAAMPEVAKFLKGPLVKGTGARLKTPEGRSYMQHRRLNERDYPVDALRVDILTMVQMMTDILDQRLINRMQADKDINHFDAIVAEAEKRTAQAREKNPKAREVTIGEVLEDKGKEHLTVWAVHPGWRIFSVDGIRGDVMAMLAETLRQLGPGQEAVIRLGRDALKQLQVAHGYQVLVIDKQIAAQLNDIRNQDFVGATNVLNDLVSPVTTLWKRMMLVTPMRAIRYGLNNLVGDLEGVFMAQPEVLAGKAEWAKVAREMWEYFVNGRVVSRDVQKAVAAGVMSGITVGEITTGIHENPVFEHLFDKVDEARPHKAARQIGRILWRIPLEYGARANNFRESLLRYKAFLYYLRAEAEVEAGTRKAETIRGASRTIAMEGLTAEERAGKKARELLGDYEAIGAMMQGLRRGLVPFGSWADVVVRRYKRVFENVWLDRGIQGWSDAARLALPPATRAAMGILLFSGGVALWNRLMFALGGDEDDEARKGMSKYARQRGYLVVAPPDEKGGVYYIRMATATRDLVEWVGLAEWPDVLADLRSGQLGLGEALLHVPKSAVNKAVGMLGPMKSAAEIALGRTVFPDITEPRPIRDRWTAFAQTWGLDREYLRVKNLFTPVPWKGGGDYMMGLLAVKYNDPGLASYQQVMELKFRFKERVLNQEGSSDFYTPKSEWARQYRLAKRFGDEEAAERIEAKMRELGMTREEIRKRLESADPLVGLTKRQMREFMAWITPEQGRMVEAAVRYYKETFR